MRTTALTSALVLCAGAASADPLVDVIDRGDARVVVDGVLREWQGNLVAVDQRAQVQRGLDGWTGPDDASFAFAVARDPDALYVAAEVRDDRLVRTARHGADEDALVLTLAFPNGRLWTAWEIALMPGEPGSFAGAVQSRVPRARAVAGAQIVEAPAQGGVTLEARIPWRALPGLADNLATARIRVAWVDHDRGAPTEIANGPGHARRPQELPPTVAAQPAVAAAAVDQLARFRRERGLTGTRTVFEGAGDITGAGAPERVAVFPRHVVAWGPDVAGGTNYTYLEFPDGAVSAAQLRDVTGDRRPELLVTLRASAGGFDRSLLHVYALAPTGSFQRLLARELGRASGASRVDNAYTVEGGRITFSIGGVAGYTRDTWPAGVEPGVEAPLTPWGPHRSQVWAWDAAARSFGLERSTPNADAPPPAPAQTTAASAPGPTGDDEPAEPAQPTPDVEGVLALFRQRENLPPDARPTHRATGDAAEDATPERFYVYGRTLVLVGPRYQGGRAYSSIGLPAQEGDAVVSLRAADITDDGKVEALVTVRRNVTVQVRGAPLTSQRDMLFAYSFDAAHRGRVFAVEVARRVGDASVVNRVALPRGGRNAEIAVERGAARGWTEQTYPFHDAPPQGFEPLLLPWAGAARVTWRWDGRTMARQP